MEPESHLSQSASAASRGSNTRKFDRSAAICWRLGTEDLIDVPLVTSRDTGRWVISKGNIEKREQLHQCAQREAPEEAGLKGRVSKKSIGHCAYIKDPKRSPYIVSAFPLWSSERQTNNASVDNDSAFAFQHLGQHSWLLSQG